MGNNLKLLWILIILLGILTRYSIEEYFFNLKYTNAY